MSEQIPHTMNALVDGFSSWNGVRWRFDCPYSQADPDRPCRFGLEAPKCEWAAWERGDHAPGCESVICDGRCWGAEPEECDGWDSPEIGHAHFDPDGGCALQFYYEEMGWEDGVMWAAGVQGAVPIPAKVTMAWDGERILISPVLPPGAGDRVEDGGEQGILVVCDTCGGSGVLHKPDVMPPLATPMEG